MRKRECFESHNDYVEYLERRVQYLERKLSEYRNTNRTLKLERKRYLTEMAHPKHRTVDLIIPLKDDLINLTFVAKTSNLRGKTHRYIDMTDSPSPADSDRINMQVYLPNLSDAETPSQLINQERNEIENFANCVAMKYSNNQAIQRYIKNAIISCYNQEVVDHNARRKPTIPRDSCYVKCNPDGSIVQI